MARFKIRKELSIFVAILRACVKVRNAVLPPKCGCRIKLQLFQSQSRSPDSKLCPDAVYQLPIVLGWSWTLHNALSENITFCQLLCQHKDPYQLLQVLLALGILPIVFPIHKFMPVFLPIFSRIEQIIAESRNTIK